MASTLQLVGLGLPQWNDLEGDNYLNIGKYFFIWVDVYSSWKFFGKYWNIFF